MPTEEELRDMTPEQIAELQRRNCICCLISEKKVQAKVIYDDAQCVAVLEINPANPGHMLLFPREHYLIMPQVPEETLRHLFQVSKHLSQAALRSLQVEGTNILVANGAAAGQRVPHFMIEIIPRKDQDHLAMFALPKQEAKPAELEEARRRLRKRVNELFGVPEAVEAEIVEEKQEKKPEKKKKAKQEDVSLDEIAELFK